MVASLQIWHILNTLTRIAATRAKVNRSGHVISPIMFALRYECLPQGCQPDLSGHPESFVDILEKLSNLQSRRNRVRFSTFHSHTRTKTE